MKKNQSGMRKKRKIYYNTTKEDGKFLEVREAKALNQEMQILNIFKREKRALTASEVWDLFGQIYAPLTSMRRAITNLKSDGIIEKTDEKKKGLYGQPEYKYKLLRSNAKSNKRISN